MEDRTKLLITVAASVTANCQACLKGAVSSAERAGVDKKEIQEAIAIGRMVRKGAMGKIDELALALTGEDTAETSDDCTCGAPEEEVEEHAEQNDKEQVEQDNPCGCS